MATRTEKQAATEKRLSKRERDALKKEKENKK
jgi:hypothetical protein